jgi:hypothetical protein
MIKKAAAALLFILLVFQSAFGVALADPGTDAVVIKPGEQSDNVILLQMRLQDLGYYNYKITGFFGNFTKLALKDFQKTNSLTADGVAGSGTIQKMYSNSAKRNPIVDTTPKPKAKTKKHSRYGEYLDWFKTVQNIWAKSDRSKVKVVDFDTGKSYYVIRVGGHNHADVEPATLKDCQIFKSTYGGSWSWERRAVIVYVGGHAIAGSTNGMPHGYETIPNNGMTGQVCIHFLNSRNHVHNMIDAAHQYEVKRAAGLKVGSKPPALADD